MGFIKKILMLFLCVMMTASGSALVAYGQVATKNIDVRTLIDYTPIESYAINGNTYVVAERLADYGFDVAFDNDTQGLILTRIRFSTPFYTKGRWEETLTGQQELRIVDSGVKVYLDGQLAESFDIGGRQLIMVDELRRYGSCEHDESQQEILVTIFQHELQQELGNASGVVTWRTEYGLGNSYTQYTGQVDENNLPNGIGRWESKGSGQYYNTNVYTDEEILGYFSAGKSVGNTYKQFSATSGGISGTIKTVFIGKIGGEAGTATMGVASLPYTKQHRFGDAPQGGAFYSIDNDQYMAGCWFEKCSTSLLFEIYQTWLTEDNRQTELITKGRSQALCFYEYQDGTAIFRDGRPDLPVFVYLNQVPVSFDTTPVIVNGRILIPLRAVTEAMGCDVGWYGDSQMIVVQKAGITVEFVINSPIMNVTNGDGTKQVVLDVTPQLVNNRTMVPLRAISEALGATVEWNDRLKQVDITQ